MKLIFHLDMDAFFVSVEELFNPSLKGKPVVVGGQRGQRGVVSAASYAARRFGVHSAMPLRTAGRLCPQAIFVDGHPHRYREYSHKVYEVLQSFTPLVEMASIDEAYLDLTGAGRLHGPPLRAAHELHNRIHRATNLNCSIGAATSRLVAKVASDQAKPNGVLWILPGQEAKFLAPLEIRKIPGVGKVTEKNLHAIGVTRVGDLAGLEETFLERRFGKLGLALAGKARGLDAGGWFDGEIGDASDPKSISHEHTFSEDTAEAIVLEAMLARLSEMVGRRLREHALHARTVQLKLRYSDFSTFTRAHTLDHATKLDNEILDHVRRLFRKAWTGAAVRLIGVHVSSFEDSEGQLSLLDGEKNARWSKALSAADRIRDRFGESSISLAGGLKSTFRERVHENPASLPGKTPRPGKNDAAVPPAERSESSGK
ncbi:MAG: DNA polymerase IV [Bryobacterales bacterium]|nr:DNA polymerase IV [Bryobacterales bacterium]MEB2362339.1 DNA polymerase IV [Bryobacterales bacterium]